MQGSLRVFFIFLLFLFALGKPKIASFENLHSIITISSFCSISGFMLLSCRIIVNMYKIGKTAAAATIVRNILSPRFENYFMFLLFSVLPEIIINSCSNNTKIIIF